MNDRPRRTLRWIGRALLITTSVAILVAALVATMANLPPMP